MNTGQKKLVYSAMLLCDFYKLSHRLMYPDKTQLVYATWTPRTSRIQGINKVVVAGNQAFIKEWLIDFFNENFFSRPKAEVVAEYVRVIRRTLFVQAPDTSHIEALHDLGYLPLLIKAVPEGTIVPVRTPVLTIQNTHPAFFWLTNYIETLASCELWPMYTAATIAHNYRKVLDAAAMATVGNTDFVQFQGHDFSMRGMLGFYGGVKTGMGHLLSFVGTDTIPAILGAEYYYNADLEKDLIGTSINASEHSIECAYDNDDEYVDRVITKVHPNGFVSLVLDGRDFYKVLTDTLPSLKNKIMARDGKVVVRPDSGDPVKIVCGNPNGKTEVERKGAIESLWGTFGGTVTPKGFKLLDPHIGLIYGDAITLQRAQEITKRLADKGFASINIVFGIGSFTYQYNTRDTFGFALKSTAVVIDGKEKAIFKDPKTDDGTKKSQRGCVWVTEKDGVISFTDGHLLNSELPNNLLQPIFKDGHLVREETFAGIRKRLQMARQVNETAALSTR